MHELSGGIPFLTQLLVENDVTDGGPIPPTIADVVRAGLDRLSTSGRVVVEAASVESRLIPHDLWWQSLAQPTPRQGFQMR